MKRMLMVMFITGLVTIKIDAQTVQDSVKAVIKQLFDGMKNSDGAMIRSAFGDSAILQSVGRDTEGKIRIKKIALMSSLDGSADLRKEQLMNKLFSNL